MIMIGGKPLGAPASPPGSRPSDQAPAGPDAARFDPSRGGLLVQLPWPPKQLTPNFKRRKHWSVYRPYAANYRASCAWLVKAARARGTVLSITFCPPDRRKRDDDGMIGSFKAGRDGVADALGCDDHTFRPTYKFGDPVKGGAVIVEIGELF